MTLYVRRKKSGGTLADVVSNISNHIRQQGGQFADSEVGKMVVSVESLSDAQFTSFENTLGSMESFIQSTYEGVLGEEGKLTKAQKAAGAIVAMAFGAPGAYAKAATTGTQ